MEKVLKYFSSFSATQLKQIKMLDSLYKDWNSKINVISRKDIDSLYEKHVLHSLAIAAIFEFEPGMEIIDIGTGGGFPGIPLAIFFPEVKFHLIDSIAKKLKVVSAVAESIELKNVSIQQTRVEEIKYSSQNSAGKYDFAVSRAVAPLKDLWRWSKPLLKVSKPPIPNNNFSAGLICMKGGDLVKEIQESGTMPRVIEISEIFAENYFKEKYLLFIPR